MLATFCVTKKGRSEDEKPETDNWHRCFSQMATDAWLASIFRKGGSLKGLCAPGEAYHCR